MPSISKRRQAGRSKTDQNHASPITDSSPPSSSSTSAKLSSSLPHPSSTASHLSPTASAPPPPLTASDPAPRMTTSAANIGQDSKSASSATAVASASNRALGATGQEGSLAAGSRVRRRKQARTAAGADVSKSQVDGHSDMPTLPPEEKPHPKWVLLALLSGGFAAMNGVFAKLALPFVTPTVVELVLRAIFFGLNLASNAVMWVLFTRALTSHPSSTKVSVVNTSANFALTAVMGALVFREAVGGIGGIIGLSLLVAGCVVLGAQKEKSDGSEGEDGAVAADGPIVDPEIIHAQYKDDVEDLTTGETTIEELIDLQNDLKEEHDPGAILDGTEDEDEYDDEI